MNINTNQSKTKNVLFGVPQGSILGILLYLSFINDLPLIIGDSIRSVYYADDTTLFGIGLDKDTCTLEYTLQHALNLHTLWCLEKFIIISIDKTKHTLISGMHKRKYVGDYILVLVYDNFDFLLTSCEKVLGIHRDDNLTWAN